MYTLAVYTFFRRYLPETGITLVALFFVYRELGTFPRAWLDEGLFIMTAKNLALGHGYAIPLLDHLWYYPYFLAIGPAVILPSALSIKLFGISVAAARFPMTLYILGTAVAMYMFTRDTEDRRAARWTVALLVTLSAFVNTGKPVLGEIPAFFFLLLGLLMMERVRHPVKRGVVSGILFGIAVMTKFTFVLILPALGIAWIVAIGKRQWREAASLAVAGALALVVYLPWRWLEIIHTPAGSLTEEVAKFVFGGGNLPVLNVLRNNPDILLRLPFIAFFVMFALGMAGLWSARIHATRSSRIAITVTVILFILFFLNSYGWYRHLLPAHLLLLPFVPAGMMRLTRRWEIATVLLGTVVLTQAIWQLTHQGSGRATALMETVRIVREEYTDTDLLIEEPEVFAQLPDNPHWLYYIREGVSPTMPDMFRELSKEQRCFSRLRRLDDAELQKFTGEVAAGYAWIIPPQAGCAR